jgi:hypothetical protein
MSANAQALWMGIAKKGATALFEGAILFQSMSLSDFSIVLVV